MAKWDIQKTARPELPFVVVGEHVRYDDVLSLRRKCNVRFGGDYFSSNGDKRWISHAFPSNVYFYFRDEDDALVFRMMATSV